MQACTDLENISRSIRRRIAQIEGFRQGISSAVGYERRIYTAHVVIEIDNLIIQGLREVLVSCLVGARTCAGHRVKTSRKFRNDQEVAAFALSVLNPAKYSKLGSPNSIKRTDEQKFRDPQMLMSVLKAAGASNTQSVQLALNLNHQVFYETSVFRNFYAHRNADTFEKVSRWLRKWGITKISHVDEIATLTRPARPFPVLNEWTFEVREFFSEVTR